MSTSRTIHAHALIFFAAASALVVTLFHMHLYAPLPVSLLLAVSASAYVFYASVSGRLGFLVALFWALFALPFIHLFPYLWFDFSIDYSVKESRPDLLWGLLVNDYMLDKAVIEVTASIGTVAALGASTACAALTVFRQRFSALIASVPSGSAQQCSGSTGLALPTYVSASALAGLLLVLASPQSSIFVAKYTEASAIYDGRNFGSAVVVASTLLVYLFCDACFDRLPARKRLKFLVFFPLFTFGVGFLQLLRGEREMVPLVFALAVALMFWSPYSAGRSSGRRAWLAFGAACFFGFACAFIVGAMRSEMAGITSAREVLSTLAGNWGVGGFRLSGIIYGTWSAALLTPLSVAGDYIYGSLELRFGKTYVDLFKSIPPGFVADFFSYTRPIDGTRGPAWEMRYGIGGTHATVVPFMNFLAIGVFLSAVVSVFLVWLCEAWARSRSSVVRLALLISLVSVMPFWLWYGEKYFLNAMIIWAGFGLLYVALLEPSYFRRFLRVAVEGKSEDLGAG